MWNKIFWAVFVTAAVTIIIFIVTGFFYSWLLFGLIIIALGTQMLALETTSKKAEQKQEKLKTAINRAIEQLNQNHPQSEKEILELIERRNRETAKKIIELENKLNEISRAFLYAERVRSGRDGKIRE